MVRFSFFCLQLSRARSSQGRACAKTLTVAKRRSARGGPRPLLLSRWLQPRRSEGRICGHRHRVGISLSCL